MEDKKNMIYSATFVKDIPQDVGFNIEPSSLKINKTRTTLYLSLYAYAFEDMHEDTTPQSAIIEIVKLEEGYQLLDHYILYPEVVDSCPIDYVEIPINVLPLSAYHKDETGSSFREQLEAKWDHMPLEDILEGIMSLTSSLERRGVEDITTIPNIRDMKKYAIDRVQREKDLMMLEPFMVMLDLFIADEDDEHPEKSITFYRSIRDIADQRNEKLMKDPKSEKTPAVLTPLSDITLDNLKKHLKKYDKKDMDAFMNSLHGDSPQADLDKAQYIRDYLQSA